MRSLEEIRADILTLERETEGLLGDIEVRQPRAVYGKLRVYADTPVIGGCLDEEFSGPSRRLIERCATGDATFLVSDLTLDELENAPRAVQDVLGKLGVGAYEVIPSTRKSERWPRVTSRAAPSARRCAVMPAGRHRATAPAEVHPLAFRARRGDRGVKPTRLVNSKRYPGHAFKPYPAYKDSEIEWLGKVPAHWEVRRPVRSLKCESAMSTSTQETVNCWYASATTWMSTRLIASRQK